MDVRAKAGRGGFDVIRLDRISTRGGDGGQTSLGDGQRVEKDSLRVEAIGAVDEANAAIGLVPYDSGDLLGKLLLQIQNDLFDLGADLCVPTNGKQSRSRLRIGSAYVSRLEQAIDSLNGDLAPLRSFVLPGGTRSASFLHFARTTVRRAERRIVALRKHEEVGHAVLHYLNRLSDLLFVMARFANHKGRSEILWRPGRTQETKT